MTYDPFGEDPDADIFRDENEDTKEKESTAQATPQEDIEDIDGHRHRVDGQVCNTCNIAHGNGSIYQELPAEAIEALLELLDNMPDHLVRDLFDTEIGIKNRREADLLTTFMRYTENKSRRNKDGPLLQAIMEYIDEQSNGAVSARWRAYEAERKLVIGHEILKNVNDSLEEARQIEEASVVFLSLLELVLDIAHQRVEHYKKEYLEASYDADYAVNDAIMENGVYPENYAEGKSDLVHEFILK